MYPKITNIFDDIKVDASQDNLGFAVGMSKEEGEAMSKKFGDTAKKHGGIDTTEKLSAMMQELLPTMTPKELAFTAMSFIVYNPVIQERSAEEKEKRKMMEGMREEVEKGNDNWMINDNG